MKSPFLQTLEASSFRSYLKWHCCWKLKAGTAPWHCALMASVVSQGRWSAQANCQDHLHHGEAHHGAVHHAQALRGKLLCFLGIALLKISWNASRALLFLFWIDIAPPGNVPLLYFMNLFLICFFTFVPGSSCRGGSSYGNGSSRGYEERTYGYGGSGYKYNWTSLINSNTGRTKSIKMSKQVALDSIEIETVQYLTKLSFIVHHHSPS